MALDKSIDSLPAASLQIHQELWEASEKISSILSWAEAVGIWLVSLPLIFLASSFWHQVLILAYLDLIVGGAVFVVTGAFGIFEAHRAKGVMDEWESRMLPFFYVVKFELLPVQEPTRELDIWKRFQSLYGSLDEVGKTRTLMFSSKPKVEFNAQVKGKKSKHSFSVYGRQGDDMLLLVRRYTGEQPVGVEDLQSLRDEAADVVRYERPSVHVVAAFSSSGFAPEAVEYARREDSLVSGALIDLIRETPTGYTVVSVLTD